MRLRETVRDRFILTIRRRKDIVPLDYQGVQSMTDKSGDLVQGTLDMLILKIVALEPMHGYGIEQQRVQG